MADSKAEISNLGYVVLGVKDLGAWANFAQNIIGFQVKPLGVGNSLVLRMDERRQRIVLEENPADDILEAGWEFESAEALEHYVENLRARGTRIERAGPDDCSKRGVEGMYRCDDPNGFAHAFYFGPSIAPLNEPFYSTALSGDGFETGDLGVGHIVASAKDYKESVSFYQSVLGLRVSDYIRQEVAPGFVADVTFMHTKTGRHHSLATATLPGEKILSHLMVQVRDMNDVGLAYERCIAAGIPMFMHLGHHPNDKMFSFYVATPSGFALEVGYGGIVIDEGTWSVVTYSRLSDWGHKQTPPAAA
jgi:2,3-dihydroxybiphenyl 1,2-dioxygenase